MNETQLPQIIRFAKSFAVEHEHLEQVAFLAKELFRETQALHNLGEHEECLLVAAAWLHDIGQVISYERHHTESMYLILKEEELFDNSLDQRMVANIARYHRKKPPRESHAEFAELPEYQQQVTCMLSALLRIADGLDRSHIQSITRLKGSQQGNRFTLGFYSGNNGDYEIYGAQRKSRYFCDIFGVEIDIVKLG